MNNFAVSSNLKEFVASDWFIGITNRLDRLLSEGAYHHEYLALIKEMGVKITGTSSDEVNNIGVGESFISYLWADIDLPTLIIDIQDAVPAHFLSSDLKTFLQLAVELSNTNKSIDNEEDKVKAFGKIRHYLLGGHDGELCEISSKAALARYFHGDKGFNPLPIKSCPDFSEVKEMYWEEMKVLSLKEQGQLKNFDSENQHNQP